MATASATTARNDIAITAWGQPAAGVWPHVTLRVDGKKVGEAMVSSTSPKTYTFPVDLDPTQGHRIQVHYDNDAVLPDGDRNLFVRSIQANGKAIPANDPSVSYDRGALDGRQVTPGQTAMYWWGALNADVPKEFFMKPTPQTPAFYVSPNGKDTWTGRHATPLADGSDGPFASLERARDAMRANPTVKNTYIRGGEYHLDKTLDLTQADKGATFQAFPGETPVLSGAQKVQNFIREANGLYSAKLAQPTNYDLVIGGKRQNLAQTGTVDPQDPFKSGYLWGERGPDPKTTFKFKAGDLKPGDIVAGSKVQVFNGERLTDELTEVKSVDWATRTITLKDPAWYPLTYGITYKLLNNPKHIDQAGEFAWRASDSSVVVKPEDAAALEKKGAVVPRLGTLVKMADADGVTLKGLTLRDTTSDGSALVMDRADKDRIVGNRFVNVGNAVEMTTSSDNKIGGNTILYAGKNGVDMSKQSNRNAIYANKMNHVGELRKYTGGVMSHGVNDSLIANNTIQNSPRYGISIKNWAADNTVSGNRVENNRVLRTGQETADGGAIEMLGRSNLDTKTTIKGNHVEDVGGLATDDTGWKENYKGFGIYLDDLTGGVDISRNSFKDTSWASVFIHGGDDVKVFENEAIMTGNDTEFLRVEWAPGAGDVGLPRDNSVSGNLIFGEKPVDDYWMFNHEGTVKVGANQVANSAKMPADLAFNLNDPNKPTLALPYGSMGAENYKPSDTLPMLWG
ncbi:MAG TPA: carbohydrate-binding domain-containing protein [Azospirillaceae bacterium]|nr:carbohydrate-binding domain-containing protein [Azospirillaceae bacterium]